MSEDKKIKSLLRKFVLNRCSEEEIKEVIEYFRDKNDSSDFLTVEEVIRMIDDIPELDESSADRIYNEIITLSGQKKPEKSEVPIRKSFFWRYAAAIAVICMIAGGYLIRQNWFWSSQRDENIDQTESVLNTNEEVITLQGENGQIEIINPDGSRSVTDAEGNVIGKQEKGVLTYGGGQEIEKLVYNTLAVPYGKRFEVILSDGTSVHLNAGSSLKYPVKFLDNEENREVFVTGEAFFDVSPDTKHPFIVNTGEMDVQVLGTRFNVSSYPEDEVTDVVLVEGSVHLREQDKKNGNLNESILVPGEKGRFDKMNHEISKQKVVTSIYTAWMNGELVFRNMAFGDILRKLERHYNITVVNKNKTMAKEKFNASFGDEPLKKVLNNLSIIYGIEFTMEGNQVTVL